MKRLAILILMLAIAFMAHSQSELYDRYSKQTGVRVAEVSNFQLDSTSHVDVVMVEADDDEGWAWMKQEFLIVDLLPEQQAQLREGADVVFFARRNRSNPSEGAPVVEDKVDVSSSCYVGISYLQQAVYIFCADSEAQSDAIATMLVKKIMHSSR
ncbi:MAG: hypothetical protein IKR83_01560 [Bacteroidales bacterium]|nr:hypothetical protein [Bacteroidales bacterium]